MNSEFLNGAERLDLRGRFCTSCCQTPLWQSILGNSLDTLARVVGELESNESNRELKELAFYLHAAIEQIKRLVRRNDP